VPKLSLGQKAILTASPDYVSLYANAPISSFTFLRGMDPGGSPL
jgi:hypothetical protein